MSPGTHSWSGGSQWSLGGGQDLPFERMVVVLLAPKHLRPQSSASSSQCANAECSSRGALLSFLPTEGRSGLSPPKIIVPPDVPPNLSHCPNQFPFQHCFFNWPRVGGPQTPHLFRFIATQCSPAVPQLTSAVPVSYSVCPTSSTSSCYPPTPWALWLLESLCCFF